MTEHRGQGEGPDSNPSIANPPNIGTDLARRRAASQFGNGDDGGDGSNTLNVRVASLETRMDRIEIKIDSLLDRIGAIATRAETRNYVLLTIATFVAIIGILVTAMGWLETRATRVTPAQASPAPVVIQIPAIPIAAPTKPAR